MTRAHIHEVEAPPFDAAWLRAFEASLVDDVELPAPASVIGEPVSVHAVRRLGNARAGLTARCMRGARVHEVSLADVVFAPGSAGARAVARYRAWMGLSVAAPEKPREVPRKRLVVGDVVQLLVLASKPRALLCRMLDAPRNVTLRVALREAVPGTLLDVRVTKQAMTAGQESLTGDVLSMRVDVAALDVTPLALRAAGNHPAAPRPPFEMEQVIPGADTDDFAEDPIVDAAERSATGDPDGASAILNSLLAHDLRCLDAHAHLGDLAIAAAPAHALRHYAVGAAIGALSLGESFEGVLPWALDDNRPYLRCLHGLGLCHWRLGDVDAARAVFQRMLWLNPTDEQGVRLHLEALEAAV